ncbi:MAG: hypothetical protein HQ567_02090 [Candidatus Nealsonbacteria bacterium]|nr:hypothetical protein [Candidatus Nealsonbacteria bacterium]
MMKSAYRTTSVALAIALTMTTAARAQQWYSEMLEGPVFQGQFRQGQFPPEQGQQATLPVLAAPEPTVDGWPADFTRLPPVEPIAHYATEPMPVFSPESPAIGADSCGRRQSAPDWRLRLGWLRRAVRSDYVHYYDWPTMRDLMVGVAAGGLLANTSLDADFQDWYQQDVRDSGTDDFAAFWKTFGEGQIFIPSFACLAVIGGTFPQIPLLRVSGEFGNRVTRSYLVGAPPMLLMQSCLGGSRPGEDSVESRWKPFDDNNAVSGHAFVGAVPFITAAKMSENPWAKGCFYACSMLTPWSRVNDDAHYLSQACLGWWMAYLACSAVDETHRESRTLRLTPIVTPQMTGVAVVLRR